MNATVVTLSLILGLILLFRALAHNRAGDAYDRRKRGPRPYLAASIECGEGCCRAARELADKRFLAAEAPSIPLPGCSADQCKCRYVCFEDRRGEQEDRRAIARDGQPPRVLPKEIDRRAREDRRAAVRRSLKAVDFSGLAN